MQVKELMERYRDTVFNKDVPGFLQLFDDKVQVFDMWERWRFDGLADWQTMVKGWLGGLGNERVTVTFSAVEVQEDNSLAMLTAYVRFAAIDEAGTELRYLDNRLSWVAVKKEGTWKILHQHTSSPIDFSSMKVILQRGDAR